MTSYDLSKRAHAADHAPGGTADLSEIIQDVVAAMVVAGANVTKTYDDTAGTLTITAAGGGGGTGVTDPEVVRDTIATALRGGSNVSVTADDPSDTITIAVTGLATVATSGAYADLTGKPTIPAPYTDAQAVTANASALAAKADLVGGKVPDSQIPTRLQDVSLKAAYGPQLLAGRGPWVTATAYAVNDLVITQGGAWRCLVAHTSGASFTGTSSGNWERFVQQGPVGSSPLEAANLYRVGHSYLAGTGATGSIGYAHRTARRVGALTSQTNFAAGNNLAIDTLNSLMNAAAQTTLSTGYGMAIVDTMFNDLVRIADASVRDKTLAGYYNHLLAIVQYLRTMQGGGKVEDTAGTVTGTWTAVTADSTPAGASSGGTYKWTETQGDYWTTSGITGPEATFFLKSYDTVGSGITGAQFQIYQNGLPGTILASGSTADQMRQSTQTNTVSRGILPVRITGLPTASTAYVVKKTDASGTRLGVDCVLIPSINPITVALVKQTPLPAATPVPAYAQPFLDTLNGYIDTIAAMFPANQVIVADPSPAWDATKHVSKIDNIHPNDAGHDVYATWLAGMARALTYRIGQNLGV